MGKLNHVPFFPVEMEAKETIENKNNKKKYQKFYIFINIFICKLVFKNSIG